MKPFMHFQLERISVACAKVRGLVDLGLFFVAAVSITADLPSFRLEMQDGVLNPAQIEISIGKKKIEIHKLGKSVVEFESV